MKYLDISVVASPSDVKFFIDVLMNQIHIKHDQLKIGVDFPKYTEGEPNLLASLNPVINKAKTGRVLRLFFGDEIAHSNQIITLLDIHKMIEGDAIIVSSVSDVPKYTMLVAYTRNRLEDKRKRNTNKEAIKKEFLAIAHTLLHFNRESFSSEKSFGMNVSRTVVSINDAIVGDIENISSYGFSSGKSSMVYLPYF